MGNSNLVWLSNTSENALNHTVKSDVRIENREFQRVGKGESERGRGIGSRCQCQREL